MRFFRCFLALLVLQCSALYGQENTIKQLYGFEEIASIKVQPVCSQGKTGTCWSFATTSFLESEVFRKTGKSIKLSEMFAVSHVYENKMENYIRYHGKTTFGQGGLVHDYLRVVAEDGLVPHSAFYPERHADGTYDHSTLYTLIRNLGDQLVSLETVPLEWKALCQSTLDVFLGERPEQMSWKGVQYSPKEFAAYLKIIPSEYRHLTSFTHQPQGKPFVLEVPDNWDRGMYENVSLESLWEQTEQALANGYSLAWDADVSHPGFRADLGIAILAEDLPKKNHEFTDCVKEMPVTPESRQHAFDTYEVTDDHLMHITGLYKDKNGEKYLLVKNSWGDSRGMDGLEGYILVSKSYFLHATLSVTMHQFATRSI